MKLIINTFYEIIFYRSRIQNEVGNQEEWQGWDAWVSLEPPVNR